MAELNIFVNIKPRMQAVQHTLSIIQKAEERQWVQQQTNTKTEKKKTFLTIL